MHDQDNMIHTHPNADLKMYSRSLDYIYLSNNGGRVIVCSAVLLLLICLARRKRRTRFGLGKYCIAGFEKSSIYRIKFHEYCIIKRTILVKLTICRSKFRNFIVPQNLYPHEKTSYYSPQ